ncbi:MAG: helix-turn-helix domain-containing protein [Anaeroplasmataceae bacterium]
MVTYKFAEFLNKKRNERNITIRDFASKIGISASYLCDIEKSRKKAPKIKNRRSLYDDIASVLNLTTMELIEMQNCLDEDARMIDELPRNVSFSHFREINFEPYNIINALYELDPDEEDVKEIKDLLARIKQKKDK